jgi:hypothetical protein
MKIDLGRCAFCGGEFHPMTNVRWDGWEWGAVPDKLYCYRCWTLMHAPTREPIAVPLEPFVQRWLRRHPLVGIAALYALTITVCVALHVWFK